MVRDIVHEVVLPYPPERVWLALTDPEQLGRWLMPNDFRAQPGARYRMQDPDAKGWSGIVEGEVVEVEKEQRLVYTWQGDPKDPPQRVTWTLEAVAEGTRLRLVHTGFRGLRGVIARSFMNRGWGSTLLRERLPALLRETAMG